MSDLDVSYRIIRFFQRSGRNHTIARGLTLDEVQAHCRDPETSSRTAKGSKARRRTREHGDWFDGYTVDR